MVVDEKRALSLQERTALQAFLISSSSNTVQVAVCLQSRWMLSGGAFHVVHLLQRASVCCMLPLSHLRGVTSRRTGCDVDYCRREDGEALWSPAPNGRCTSFAMTESARPPASSPWKACGGSMGAVLALSTFCIAKSLHPPWRAREKVALWLFFLEKNGL